MTRRFLALLFISITLCASNLAASQTLSPEARFEKAVKMLQAGQYRSAIPILEDLATSNPRASNLYWNLAHAQTEVGAFGKALEAWKVYRRLEPADWHGLESLMQVSYAAGQMAEGDRARDELVNGWKSAKDADLRSQKRFCREIIMTKTGKVAVFEEFDTSVEPTIYLSFAVQSGPRAQARVTLSSDAAVEKKQRAKGRLRKDERIFTLDLSEGDTRETYRIYKHWPTYETLRQDAIDALEGVIKPISSVTVGTTQP